MPKAPFNGQSMQNVRDRLAATYQVGQPPPQFIEQALPFGILMSSTRNTSNKSLNEFEKKKLYPIADTIGPNQTILNHVTFNRSKQEKGKTVTSHRGGRCWGSKERICAFLAAQYTDEQEGGRGYMGYNMKMSTTAIYNDVPQQLGSEVQFVIPYIDIDMKVDGESDFADVYHLVGAVVQKMESYIQANTAIVDVQCLQLKNYRVIDPTTGKWSFHLHWPQVYMKDMSDLHALVKRFNIELPTQLDGTRLLDNNVYARTAQLMRLPYCGKDSDPSAVLLPFTPEQDVDGHWLWTESKREVKDVLADAWTHTNNPSNLTELTYDGTKQRCAGQVEPSMTGIVSVAMEDMDDWDDVMNFWDRVIRFFIVPNFVRFRQAQAKKVGVTCIWPNLEEIGTIVQKIERLADHHLSFRITVDCDTFCEYDEGPTPHVHDFKHSKVSYVVDLNMGRICQSCAGCKPVDADGEVMWYPFIAHGDFSFQILRDNIQGGLAHDLLIVGKASDIPVFVLQFFYDTIVYAEEAKELYVYNEASGVWCGPSPGDGNSLFLAKIERLNNVYRTSLSAIYNYRRMEKLKLWLIDNGCDNNDDPEYKKEEEKQNGICKALNSKRGVLWPVGIAYKRTGLLDTMIDDHHPHTIFRMEPNPFIIPCENGMCVDINTFIVRKIKPDDFISSAFTASIVDYNNELGDACKSWMLQVAGSDPDFLLYKMRDIGYDFTCLLCDRAFYICHGLMGNNGKGCENKLFDLITMGGPNGRGFRFKDNYLTTQGQSRESATGADGQKCDMRNKTIGLWDEAKSQELCHVTLKKLSSGDPMTARNNYGRDHQIPITMKVKLYLNTLPRINMSEPSMQARLTVIPYPDTWISDYEQRVAKEPNDEKKSHMHPEIADFKDRILPAWKHVFFSMCLYEFHLWLTTLPRDSINPAIPVLARIPRPLAVVNACTNMLESQNHTMKFKNEFLIQKTNFLTEDLAADMAFAQAQQFFKNCNVVRRMTKNDFEDELAKLGVEFYGGTTTPKRLKGWVMKMAVPVLFDPTAGGGLVEVGDFYIPAPADPPANYNAHKRGRYED